MRGRRVALHRAAVLTIVVLQTSGCHSWHAEPGMNAAALVTADSPSRVRLRLNSGQRLEVRNPGVSHDTLIGRVGPDSARVAVTDIATVAERRFSAGRTVARIGLGVALLFGVAAIACAADPCGY
ncbi:MAG TPA: hypothetical protein VMY76_05610 [Gemmatimonadales bacterium]|nr:hypothetical protein [Gemmatimonadales bacterium]